MTRKEQIESASVQCCEQIGFIVGAEWSDNHPRKGLVDINKAREWVKNVFIGPFGEGLANSIADEFVKEMEE